MLFAIGDIEANSQGGLMRGLKEKLEQQIPGFANRPARSSRTTAIR